MVPITPLETKHQLHKGPKVGTMLVRPDGCEPAYLGGVIKRGLEPNWDRTWQNGASHIAHSVILSYRNPNKTYMDRRVLPCAKIGMTSCSRSGVAHMRNELRESPTTACWT